MKNKSLFYSLLIGIIALTFTSCAKQYGCYYSLGKEIHTNTNQCPTTQCPIN
ncbi:MAG TPA: hypothetical protein VMZ69_01470 [Saprospiraceae bacterium]|nr:hypothetical protein [Saprospiraceae bacterium]